MPVVKPSATDYDLFIRIGNEAMGLIAAVALYPDSARFALGSGIASFIHLAIRNPEWAMAIATTYERLHPMDLSDSDSEVLGRMHVEASDD